MTLTSVTGLQASGVIVLDRQDGSGNNTPSLREYITYTGISGNDLTGVTRGVAGSTAQSHGSGKLAEEVFSVTHWNDLYDYLTAEHTAAGLHVMSTPTLTTPRVVTALQASGASAVGSFPLFPVFTIPGFSSAASTDVAPKLTMPRIGNWESFSVSSRTPASACSLTIDINLNGTSIFNTIGRPNILGAGTFNSTASISTKAFVKGGQFTVDIDTGGNISDIVVQGIAVL